MNGLMAMTDIIIMLRYKVLKNKIEAWVKNQNITSICDYVKVNTKMKHNGKLPMNEAATKNVLLMRLK